MTTLTISEVSEFKSSIEKQFGIKIHFHDSCGGQYFSSGTTISDMKDYILAYMKEKGLRAEFSDDMHSFFVKEYKEC